MHERQLVDRGPGRRCGLHAHKCPADAGHWPISAFWELCMPLAIMEACADSHAAHEDLHDVHWLAAVPADEGGSWLRRLSRVTFPRHWLWRNL